MSNLDQLKQYTEATHRKIEGTLAFVLSESVTPSDLRWLLSRFYTFFSVQEERLRSVMRQDSWLVALAFHERLRSPVLIRDLYKLGMRPEDLDALTFCADLPALNTSAQRLGYLYVLEGSTLGGRVINAHLAHAPALRAVPSLEYFSMYGLELNSRWKCFLNTLENFFESQPHEQMAVFTAAVDTFTTLNHWLEA